MRLTTWNVNGIRNPFSYPPWNAARTFPAMFDILGSDMVVMQELKIQRKDLRDDMVLIDGWDCYFSLPKHKKGYSGVGIYTRNATCAPIKAEEGLLGVLPSAEGGVPYCELPEEKHIGGYPSLLQVTEMGVDPAVLDAEGRCIVLEFPAFVLIGVYSPANSNGLRDDFRFGFINALDCRIRNLTKMGKRVVLVGDLNVSRDEMDGASALEDCKKAGITHADYISTPNRRIFNQLILEGEVVGERDEGREEGVLWDTTRGFHPQRTGMYTHWEQKINARPGNYGSRIDFVLVAESMKTWVKDANIQEGLLGSDHCPVFADFHDQVRTGEEEVAMLDVMNPEGVFEQGVRKQEWKVQNVPGLSGKRLPEFAQRRSIKSMFSAAPIKKTLQASPMENGPALDVAASPNISTDGKQSQSQDTAATSFSASPSDSKAPPLKRKSTATAKLPIKKQKSDAGAVTGKGQASLKGFFQTQSNPSTNATASPNPPGPPPEHKTPQPTQETAPPNGTPTTPTVDPSATPTARTASPSPTPSPRTFATTLASNTQSQASWSTLFAKPAAPLCESHNEPCKTMQTKKKGTNQGRSFWMCARPLGPSGQKERGTEWRCGTFIWCSDFRGQGGAAAAPAGAGGGTGREAVGQG